MGYFTTKYLRFGHGIRFKECSYERVKNAKRLSKDHINFYLIIQEISHVEILQMADYDRHSTERILRRSSTKT